MQRAPLTIRHDSAVNPDENGAPDLIARIEAWVAGYLDGPEPVAVNVNDAMDSWHRHALELLKPGTRPAAPKKVASAPNTGWSRIGIKKKSGTTIVRLLDRNLLRPTDLDELSEELTDLIEAGHRRVAVDFGGVERLSCGILPVLAKASQLCEHDGLGRLKTFNFHPDLVPVMGLTGLTKTLPAPSDEATAVGGPWPNEDRPRALPDALFLGIAALAASSPIRPLPTLRSNIMPRPFDPPSTETAVTSPRLVVTHGKAKGRAVRVPEIGLVIGRDPQCELRSENAQLSRRHARIRADDGRIFVQDLRSTNGTIVNGTKIGVNETEMQDGDLLQVGPLKFVVQTGENARPNDDEIAGWLEDFPEPQGHQQLRASDATCVDIQTATSPLRVKMIQDVRAITPMEPHLLCGMELGTIRDELDAALAEGESCKVVLDLQYVTRLSNAAIGVLVAYHVRMHQAGGALRLCQPHAKVAETLHQMRLSLLIDVFPSDEEAILTSWDRVAVVEEA